MSVIAGSKDEIRLEKRKHKIGVHSGKRRILGSLLLFVFPYAHGLYIDRKKRHDKRYICFQISKLTPT